MKSSLSPRRPSSSSPATSSSMTSFSNVNSSEHSGTDGRDVALETGNKQQRDRPHAPVANILEHDEKRPHAPVAKLLDDKNLQLKSCGTVSKSSSNSDGKIPNLLNSGAFPPPPHSPPTISSSPNVTSPHIPAAPPTTPYTPPFVAVGRGIPPVPLAFSDRSPPLSPLTSPNKLNHRRSPSPHPPAAPTLNSTTIASLLNQQPFTDPHYNHLLHQTLLQTQSAEQSRINSLQQHETQSYTTMDEYRHAISRERRHSLSLSLQLSYYKFLTKYQSCTLHSNLEMNEEARLNKLIKNIDDMKKNMNEDKIRVVMELEREEEGIVNSLMGRLEDVRREKMLLERQVYNNSCAGTSGCGGFGNNEFDNVMMIAQQQQQQQGREGQVPVPGFVGQFDPVQIISVGEEARQEDATATRITKINAGDGEGSTPPTCTTSSAAATVTDTFSCFKEDGVNNTSLAEGKTEEEDEEDANDDILEGHYHDGEMEEELEKILKSKELKKQ